METTSNIHKSTIPVTGMSCASCAVSVESQLKHSPGVIAASVNYANQSLVVEFETDKISLTDMDKILQGVGFGLIVEEDEDLAFEEQAENQKAHYRKLKNKTIWAGILSLPVVVIGMFFMDLPYGNYIMLVLSFVVLALFGQSFFVNAFNQAKHGKSNMDSLVALSTGIAFVFSTFNTFNPDFWYSKGLQPHVYFEAATVIIFFILLGKLMEEKAKSSTTESLKKLIGMQPKTVIAIRDGQMVEVSLKDIQQNEEMVIKSGQRIPVDGVVISGTSFVDESLLTGEPIPAEKNIDDKVFAGTINQKGSFNFRAEKVGKNTILAQIIKTVQAAQGSKAPVQKLVDKIAGIFVPVVMGIAVFTFVMWMLFGGENALTHALLASVSVLVIACPCALGLATPTAIMAGVGKGAEHNILIRDAESLENTYKVNAVILDKTGTITAGKPEVTEMIWKEDVADKAYHLNAIKLLESRSEHPLAQAIVNFIGAKTNGDISDFESITSSGVSGNFEGENYKIGTLSFLESCEIEMSEEMKEAALKLQKKAQTVVGVGVANSFLAIIAIADQIKPTSKAAIDKLRAQNLEVYMLTGDNYQTATAVASELGITDFEAEMKPQDKMDFVKKLQDQGKIVAMVGDGINDSQALVQANVSIAMGQGSDIAMDVAKITLITSDLLVLPKAIKLSKETVKTIRQNLFWAFIYNLIGIPVAAGILFPFTGFLLDPMIAGGAMALSSVSVVTNSLRLKRLKL